MSLRHAYFLYLVSYVETKIGRGLYLRLLIKTDSNHGGFYVGLNQQAWV